jgi:iron(III) transport system substrate-binding protein
MRHSKFITISLLVLLLLIGWTGWAAAGAIDELKADAKKEGTLEFLAPSSWPGEGVQALAKAFNKRYGLNIKVGHSPTRQMIRDVSRVITSAASGAAPEWDLMVVTDAHHATLRLRKLQQTFDYRKLGVDPSAIHYGNSTISIANQFVLPAYNKKILPAKDVPKSWEDLLDPKWKGGKLAINVATHHFARLAVGAWGEEKTTKYVKALAAQKPNLGSLGQVYTRLQIGEIKISATMINGLIFRAKKRGAPLVFAEGIEPVISPQYHGGVLKGALHPNVGHLFAAFLTTPEAQKILEKHAGYSSAFVPGTGAYKYVQGKKVLYMKDDQAKTIVRLAKQYGKIFGFRKKKKK